MDTAKKNLDDKQVSPAARKAAEATRDLQEAQKALAKALDEQTGKEIADQAAMEAGKNVICEKPLEIQTDRIDQMIDLAKQRGVKLAGVFQNRWNEANRALNALKNDAIDGAAVLRVEE